MTSRNQQNQKRTIIVLIVFAIVCAMSLFFGIRKANAETEGVKWCQNNITVYDGTGHWQWEVQHAVYAWDLQGAKLQMHMTRDRATANIVVVEHYLPYPRIGQANLIWYGTSAGACFWPQISIYLSPTYRYGRNQERVTQHELGHAIGEAHNYRYPWSVMYAGTAREYWSGWPDWFDAWQLRQIYGAYQS